MHLAKKKDDSDLTFTVVESLDNTFDQYLGAKDKRKRNVIHSVIERSNETLTESE